jgi:hypothetical protein
LPDKDDLRRAQQLAHELTGKPYVWGGVGPRGCDCSGFMSVLLNSLQGRPNVFVRRFATGNLKAVSGQLGLRPGLGDANDFNLGVRYPAESSRGIGHVAGTLGGLNVESRGGRGVLAGATARGATSVLFPHHFHLAVEAPRVGVLTTAGPQRLLRPYPGHLHRKNGAVHDHVKLIQQRLNQIAGAKGHGVLGGKPLGADGGFGDKTEQVVKVFQRHRGLEADGVVGPRTWTRLFHR